MKEASEKQLGAWCAVHHGFEVQINDAGDSWHRTGAIYSLAEADALPAKPPADWRTMIITLDGERVNIEVDGRAVSRFDAAAANYRLARVGASLSVGSSVPPTGTLACRITILAMWSGSKRWQSAASARRRNNRRQKWEDRESRVR